MLPVFIPKDTRFSYVGTGVLRGRPRLKVFFREVDHVTLRKLTPFVPRNNIKVRIVPMRGTVSARGRSLPVRRVSR